MPSTSRQAVPAVAGQAQRPAAAGHLAGAQDRDRDRVARLERDRPPVDDDPARLDGAAASALGHWRIRRPCGSNSGSGWSRAGRRRPMISISNPAPPGPSGVARAVGTYPSAIDRLDVVAVAARRDPADDRAVVPDRLVADDVGRVVRIGLDDERDEPPRRAAGRRPRPRAPPGR